MIRKVRNNEFRASGSGDIDFNMDKKNSLSAIKFSHNLARKLNMQTLALDLIPFEGSYLITDVSYAFGILDKELEFGYWDDELIWHPRKINPFGWRVDLVVSQIKEKKDFI